MVAVVCPCRVNQPKLRFCIIGVAHAFFRGPRCLISAPLCKRKPGPLTEARATALPLMRRRGAHAPPLWAQHKGMVSRQNQRRSARQLSLAWSWPLSTRRVSFSSLASYFDCRRSSSSMSCLCDRRLRPLPRRAVEQEVCPALHHGGPQGRIAFFLRPFFAVRHKAKSPAEHTATRPPPPHPPPRSLRGPGRRC